MTPGPGHYTSLNVTTEAPKYTMSSRRNLPINTSTPGPGTYNNNNLTEVPSYKMTQSKRDISYRNINPGPGSYNAISRPKSSAPLYGFGSQTRHGRQGPHTPGPGAYNHLSKLQSQLGQTFAGESRLREHGKDMPGPGAYNPVKKSKMTMSNTKIGQAKRDTLNIKQLVLNPGPGQYQSNYNQTLSSMPNCRIGQESRSKVRGT